MSHVNKTKDYDKFQFFPENRNITTYNALKKSLEHRNMLEFHPIHVNSEFYIIDGQHRFCAARDLGLPIYFIVDEKASIDDIAYLNSSTKNWKIEEYTEHFIKRGNDNYKFIKELHDKYGFPYYFLMFITASFGEAKKNKQTLNKIYREGKLKLRKTKEEIRDICDKIFDIIEIAKSYRFKICSDLYFACHAFVNNGKYKHAIFLSKLRNLPALFELATKYHAQSDITNKFKEIFNFKQSVNKIE